MYTDYKDHTKLNSHNRRMLVTLLVLCAILAVSSYKISGANSEQVAETNQLNESVLSTSQSTIDLLSGQDSTVNSNSVPDPSAVGVVSISGDSLTVDVDSSTRAVQSESTANISVEISNSTNPETSEPSIVVNGNEIEIPANGRLRETIKDDNSTTRLRTNVDSSGSSSISIETKSN